jgi:eukaryotic-like serine/threonine-protein kinase
VLLSLAPNLQIPGIELGPELGQGAHSIVYRGWVDGVPCAVKLPRRRAPWVRWVYREALALARVQHDALPRVFEVGEVDGLPFLAMELVEGETLAHRLLVGRMPEAELLALARPLLSALGAVHRARIVHRDVKPSNIIVDSHGRVRLVDFGFATPLERTSPNESAGTLRYAAPEQLQSPSNVDGRSDLFALGRVLTECLLGHLPPSANEHQLRALLENGGVSSSLATVVLGLVAVDPDRRYAHADAAREELALIAAGALAKGPSGYPRTHRAPPTVGREDSLRIVARTATETGRRNGSVAIVNGPRGSGRTAFLAGVADRARDAGVVVLEARCRTEDPPLACLRRLFVNYTNYLETLDPARRLAGSDALRAAAEDDLSSFVLLIAPRLNGILTPASQSPTTASTSFAEGVAEVFVRLSRRIGPLLLAVDDLWAMDPASREVLIRVAHRCAEAPLTLILTDRDTNEGAGPDARIGTLDADRLLRLEMVPLTEHQRAELIVGHLGTADVDPLLIDRVNALSGGTPLGVLEVVGAFLDSGALRLIRGRWQLDPTRASGIVLPDSTQERVDRRLRDLPAATRTVLEAAATLGPEFDLALLAAVVGVTPRDLGFAAAQARRAGLLDMLPGDRCRWVHDSLRDGMLSALPSERAKDLHRSVADALERSGPTSPETAGALALHYVRAGLDYRPQRAEEAANTAAEGAFLRFDNESARRFFHIAKQARALTGKPPDAATEERLGEVELRLGALDASLACFHDALTPASPPRSRARLFGRIAWVHHMRAEPSAAWPLLAEAFRSLDRCLPNEAPRTVAENAAALLSQAVTPAGQRAPWTVPAADRGEAELLCELHYQNARLGLEYGKPLRTLQSVLAARDLTADLQGSRANARARAMHGFLLSATGMRERGAGELALAQEEARRLGDPVVRAFCVQLAVIGALWAGDFARGLTHLQELLDQHGPWLELSDFVNSCLNGDAVETVRGRVLSGWAWLERAIDRARRSPTGMWKPEPFFLERIRANWAALGRDHASDPRLVGDLSLATSSEPPEDSFRRTLWWGPRARAFADRGETGLAFESLVRAFEREAISPRTAHPALFEYYVTVAHARVHQCFRASPKARALRLTALRRARDDLRLAARNDLFRAHVAAIDGIYAQLCGKTKEANRALELAESLGRREAAPWVLYAVARARAHALAEAGRPDAAKDQARVAVSLALAHGAVVRARWVTEEFSLGEHATADRTEHESASAPSLRRVRRQLASLVQIVRSPAAASEPNQHAAAILDDLLRDLDAERGALWFEPDPAARAQPFFARHRRGDSWNEPEGVRTELLRAVRLRGEPWPSAGDSPSTSAWAGAATPTGRLDAQRTLAVPLFLFDTAVGAVCLERDRSAPPFSEEDRELLMVLTHQVPIALELTRLLTQREQLQTSLQHAQKMEAVGQLAGGIAHDFNNMLMVIQTSLDTLRERPRADGDAEAELELIGKVADRAGELTKQLLGFSRHRPLALAPHRADLLLDGLAPMLRRVMGPRGFHLQLSSNIRPINTDRASFEQAIVNLAVNARDATPRTGNLTIASYLADPDDPIVRRLGESQGDHLVIAVSDDGQGMAPELRERAFEPFFTTKPLGGGTGLGLTMVYTFMKGCGGFVDLSSEVGRGTTFRLYFPLTTPPPSSRVPAPPRRTPPRASLTAGTVLVVDDDPLVARSIAKVLSRNGYNVLVAIGAQAALAVMETSGTAVSVAVLDVLMPGMSGPQLGQLLLERNAGLKLLYVSGFAPQSVGLPEPTQLLQKPFSAIELVTRVRDILEQANTDPPAGAHPPTIDA